MIASTDERPYAKAGKLTKKEIGNGIHNCNPKSLRTVKVQRSSKEPKSRDILKLMKQSEKSRSKSNIITRYNDTQSSHRFHSFRCEMQAIVHRWHRYIVYLEDLGDEAIHSVCFSIYWT
jgi:isopropylmalate/homocitrate/citramalate synthase